MYQNRPFDVYVGPKYIYAAMVLREIDLIWACPVCYEIPTITASRNKGSFLHDPFDMCHVIPIKRNTVCVTCVSHVLNRPRDTMCDVLTGPR